MKWVLLGVWLTVGAAWGAAADPLTLPYLQQHADDCPKQVALKQAVVFSVVLDGKTVGSVTLPEGTEVNLLSVGDVGVTVAAGSNQAVIPPEQTDLWERVKAIRDVRATFPDPSTSDPAVNLQLPTNSVSADWYHQQLVEKIDPWLAKYPMSPLFDQMQVRRTIFYAESVRVGNGEVRRGDQWYSAEEAADRALDFEAEDLLACLGQASGHLDAAELEKLVAEIPKYGKTESHPTLVRTALAAIDNLLPTLSPDAAKQSLQSQRETLSTDRDKNDATLRAMLNHPRTGYDAKPATAPPGGSYFFDNYTHLYYLNPGGNPGGVFNSVYAHHYPGLLKYYPDDKSLYPPLSDPDLATAQQLAAAIAKDEQQMAQIDRQLAEADDAVAKQRTAWTQRREALARIPVAAEEKTLQDLQAAASLDPIAVLPVLQKAAGAWPDNRPAHRLALAKAWDAMHRIYGEIDEGKISEASKQEDAIQKLIAFSGSSPWLDQLHKAADELAPQIAAAAALEKAYAARDYDQIAAAPPAPAAFQKWQAALEQLVARQKAASHAAIEEIEPDLLRFEPHTALAAFQRAKELWPTNPEVVSAARMLWIAAAAGGLVALGILMVIWERLTTLFDHLRFKRRMKA